MKMAKSCCAAQVSPSRWKLLSKIKTLKQKVKRQESRIVSLRSISNKVEHEKYIATDATSLLKQNFSGINHELLQSELKNQHHAATGHRFTDEVK